jgi:hypothetical protein
VRALAALALCGATLAQERAFVEVTAPKDAYYVGERVPLTLRFGYDRAFFEAHAVPLFPRRTDVLLHVQAQVPGGPAEAPSPRGPTFALNDGIVEAEPLPDEIRDGRTFAVLAWRRRLAPAEAGDLVVPAPTLRYVHATVFEEDFVAGRIAKDPRDAVVRGAPLTLRILPLPEEGRPPGFAGAVGRFTIAAQCGDTSVDAGEIFGLTVTIRGDGDATLSRLDIKGFHVFGTAYKGEGKTAILDIAALSSDIREIPAIPFAFFDPGPPAGYRVVRTEPIPLEVRPRAKETPPTPPPPAAEDATSAVLLVVVGLLVAIVAGLLGWLHLRSGREPPPDPEAARVREALATLRARVASGGSEPAEAFAAFLAAYLKCAPAAVIGPDLASRLVARGFPEDLASGTAATLERLVAARYGAGGMAADDLAPLLAGIEALLPSPRG